MNQPIKIVIQMFDRWVKTFGEPPDIIRVLPSLYNELTKTHSDGYSRPILRLNIKFRTVKIIPVYEN